MKICILMLIHKDIELTNRLISKLKNNNIDIYVHVDLKSKLNIDKLDKDVKLIKNRSSIFFADQTQLDAVITCLKEIKSKQTYDYYIFLSGQDYPIVSSDEIVKFFENNKGKEFIDYKKLDKAHWNVAYRFEKPFSRNRYIRFIIRKLPIKLKFIKDYVPYGGDAWFNMTDTAVTTLLRDYEERKINKRVKYMEMPEEIIYQSIILNSSLRDNVVNNSLRYIDWSEHAAGLNIGHPNILTENDYNNVINSGKLFCRKMDAEKSKKLMDMLDEYISTKK